MDRGTLSQSAAPHNRGSNEHSRRLKIKMANATNARSKSNAWYAGREGREGASCRYQRDDWARLGWEIIWPWPTLRFAPAPIRGLGRAAIAPRAACARAARGAMRLACVLFMKPKTEGWPSGRRRTPGKCVYGKPYRGFESRPLRHSYHLIC
jgi:hypothetical protein